VCTAVVKSSARVLSSLGNVSLTRVGVHTILQTIVICTSTVLCSSKSSPYACMERSDRAEREKVPAGLA
jgi:hypothetical protein